MIKINMAKPKGVVVFGLVFDLIEGKTIGHAYESMMRLIAHTRLRLHKEYGGQK